MGQEETVGAGFDRGAADYDRLLARNREGAARLVAALPAGEHARLLDVGCGTGFATLASAERFPLRHVTGVDPSEGMLERFRAALAARPGIEVRAHLAGVHEMSVAEGAFDLALSAMAFHWFPDKQGALRAMARALRPGGVLGVLASGRGTDEELRRVLLAMRPPPPPAWTEVFTLIDRDMRELESYLVGAGLDPLDVWEEHRVRRVPADELIARVEAVSAHLSAGLDPDEAEAERARFVEAVRASAGPRGFEYGFVKLFGVARKPG